MRALPMPSVDVGASIGEYWPVNREDEPCEGSILAARNMSRYTVTPSQATLRKSPGYQAVCSDRDATEV